MNKIMSLTDFIEMKESTQLNRFAGSKNPGKRTKEEEVEFGKDSAFNFVWKNAGVTFEPGVHGPSQAKDRRPEFDKDDWKKLHRKVFWYLKDNKIKTGTFLFYNEEMQQGYVAALGKGGSEIRIITVLPKGKYDPRMGAGKGDTELVIVEEIMLALAESGLMFESIDTLQTLFV